MKKRLLALVMAVVMTIGSVPMSVFADLGEIAVQQEMPDEEIPAVEAEEPEEAAEEAEEAEKAEPVEAAEETEIAGQVILMDADGSCLDTREFQTEEEALDFCNQENLNADSLKLTLARDWETEDFLFNTEQALDIDLGGFTWTVTGKEGLETEKAVKIADGTLTFAKLEGFALCITDGGLELTKVVFLDSVTEAEALICVTREESENLDWFVTEEVDFENCLCSGEDFILTQEPEAMPEEEELIAEEEEPAQEQEEPAQEQEETDNDVIVTSRVLGANTDLNDNELAGAIGMICIDGNESSVKKLYSVDDIERQLSFFNSKSEEGTIYIKLAQDWTTNAFIQNTVNPIKINLNGHRWTVIGAHALETSKRVEIYDGTMTFNNFKSVAVCVNNNQLTVRNVKFLDCKASSAEYLLHVRKTNTLDVFGYILEDVLVDGLNCTFIEMEMPNIQEHSDLSVISNNYFRNCTFQNISGEYGAVANLRGTDSSVLFENCHFVNNNATQDGGCLHTNDDRISIKLVNCVFDRNRAGEGGAIYLRGEGSSVYMGNTVIMNGSAVRGGAIYTYADDQLMDGQYQCNTRSVIRSCYASDDGGAIYIYGDNQKILNLQFISNSVDDEGGALYIHEKQDGHLIKNCYFGYNKAGDRAGAIYFKAAGSDVQYCVFNHDYGVNGHHEIHGQSEGRTTNCEFYSSYSADSLTDNKVFKVSSNHYHNGSAPGPWVTDDNRYGEGTKEAPYLIVSEEFLSALTRMVSEGESFTGVYFRQTVDLKDIVEPIGNQENGKYFSGHYDGGGHSVTLAISAKTEGGLFGYLSLATIQDLIVKGFVHVNGDLTEAYAGSVAAYATNSTILRCINEATITGVNNVGGILGFSRNCIAEGCTNNQPITGTGSSVGGILGSGVGFTANDCTNNKPVTGTDCVGGIVGSMSSYHTSIVLYLTGCINSGRITATHANAGGILGAIDGMEVLDVTIQGCRNNPGAVVTSSGATGGIVGVLRCSTLPENILIRDCTNGAGLVSPLDTPNNIGGIVGFINGSTKTTSIDHCTNQGSITFLKQNMAEISSGITVGGIAGVANGTVINCSNSGSITVPQEMSLPVYAGGLVGLSDDLALYNSVNSGRLAFYAQQGTYGIFVGKAGENIDVQNLANQGEVTGTTAFVGSGFTPAEGACLNVGVLGSKLTASAAVKLLNAAAQEHENWLAWRTSLYGGLELYDGNSFEVWFDYNYTNAPAPKKITVKKGAKLTPPEDVVRNGYDAQWYKDYLFREKWDFDKDTVTSDLTLYAKWVCRHDNLKAIYGQQETDEQNGIRDCWYCDNCEVYFLDQTCTKAIGGDGSYFLWSNYGEGVIPRNTYDYYRINGENGYLEHMPLTNLRLEVLPEATAWGQDGQAKWYLATQDMTLDSLVNVHGQVNLILKDGITVTLNHGLHLEDYASLNIYGQSVGTTVGKLVVKGDSSTKHAITGGGLLVTGKAKPVLNIISGELVAEAYNKEGSKLNKAVGMYVDVQYEPSHLIRLTDTADSGLPLGIDLTALIDDDSLSAKFLYTYVRYLPVMTGDLSAFKKAFDNLDDTVADLSRTLSKVQQEIAFIPGIIDTIPALLQEVEGMLSFAKDAKSAFGKFLHILADPSANNGHGMSAVLLKRNGVDISGFHYAEIDEGDWDSLWLLGAGDDAQQADAAVRILRNHANAAELAQLTMPEGKGLVSAQEVVVQWPSSKLFEQTVCLGLHVRKLADYLALGEIEVWQADPENGLQKLDAVVEEENEMLYVTAEPECVLYLVSTLPGGAESCAHENKKHMDAVLPNCIRTGVAEHWLCLDCGRFFADAEGQEPLEHPEILAVTAAHAPIEYVERMEPTCLTAGYEAHYACGVCGKLFADAEGTEALDAPTAIRPLGHEYEDRIEKAMPGQDGRAYQSCIRCGLERSSTVIAAPAKVTAESRNIKGLIGRIIDRLLPKIVVTDTLGEVIPAENYHTVVIGNTAWVIFRGERYTGKMHGKIR